MVSFGLNPTAFFALVLVVVMCSDVSTESLYNYDVIYDGDAGDIPKAGFPYVVGAELKAGRSEAEKLEALDEDRKFLEKRGFFDKRAPALKRGFFDKRDSAGKRGFFDRRSPALKRGFFDKRDSAEKRGFFDKRGSGGRIALLSDALQRLLGAGRARQGGPRGQAAWPQVVSDLYDNRAPPLKHGQNIYDKEKERHAEEAILE